MAYRIVVVEDDAAEAARLQGHLSRYAAEHGLSLAVRVLASATEYLSVRPVADLVFMDIALPGVSGMEAAEALRAYDDETPLVFVTTLARYAVEGYRVDALDFLVKPVSYGDFVPRMDRAMRVVARRSQGRLVLPTHDGVRVVRLEDVLYVDIVKHNLRYHLAGEDEPLVVRGTIAGVVAELAGRGFVKLSSGCVANMAQVARIRAQSVVMSDGAELWFSRSQRKPALETLSQYVGGSL